MKDRHSIRGRLAPKGGPRQRTLEAYHRAGIGVYELLRQVEERRLELELDGADPWGVSPARQAELLCAWNASTLQGLGDHLLDAYRPAGGGAAGHLPRCAYAQALAFYHGVEGWLNLARQAQSNPGFRLDLSAPATLPVWTRVRPPAQPYLEGLLAAMRALRTQAEAEVASFRPGTGGIVARKQAALRQLRQLLAEANGKAEYALDLGAAPGPLPRELCEPVERHARCAIELYWRLGQLMAMPHLIEMTRPAPTASAALPHPGDGDGYTSAGPGSALASYAPGLPPALATPYAYGIGARYAGFGTRAAAFLLDIVIIGVIWALALDELSFADGEALLTLVAWWMYTAGMESSPLEATVGKLALGLRVTDLRGERLTFARASGRHFAQVLSLLLCCLGYLLALLTRRHQALHDVLAGTVVVDTKPAPELGPGLAASGPAPDGWM